MNEHQRPASRRGTSCVVWVVVLLVFAGGGGAALYIWERWHVLSAEHELAAAHEQWATRPFKDYVLTLERIEPPMPPCEQIARISNEKVVMIQQDRCASPAQSVSELFDSLEQRETSSPMQLLIQSRMTLNCKNTVDIEVQYHPTLGYPEQIKFHFGAHPAWLRPELWEYLWHSGGKLPNCVPMASERSIKVRSLTPLP